jgi:hypothetical protein
LFGELKTCSNKQFGFLSEHRRQVSDIVKEEAGKEEAATEKLKTFQQTEMDIDKRAKKTGDLSLLSNLRS